MGDVGKPLRQPKTCLRCGAEFRPSDWRNDYCGRRCAALVRGEKRRGGPIPTKVCERCGEVFEKNAEYSYAVWKTIRFCSRSCRGNNRPQTLLVCATCGDSFVKRQYSYAARRYYCSRACYWLSLRTERYPVRNRRIGQEFSHATRRTVIERTGGRCESCGADEHLEFDHVVPCHLGGTNGADNCQVLCRACHRVKTTAEIRAANGSDHEGF